MNSFRSIPAIAEYNAAWLAGAALLLAASALVIFAPQWMVRAYLFAYLVCLNITLGCMAVLLIHGLSGGTWGQWLSAPSRAAVATLPGFALLMIPLWFSLSTVFPWADVNQSPPIFRAHQSLWLQPWLQIVRTIIYFAVWLSIAAGMAVWSFGQSLNMRPLRTALSLIAFVVFTSLFAIDWIVALTTESSTTMIGFLLISEQLVASLALAALWISIRRGRHPQGKNQQKAQNDVGNLLLSAVMFHGYCLYMDYLIVWEGNLPREIAWYIERTDMFGGSLMWMIAILYIALPVCLLLFRRVKASAKSLGAVAGFVLLGHLLLVYWYLTPLLRQYSEPDGMHLWLWDWLLGVGLMAVWSGVFYALATRMEQHSERRK